MTYDENKIRVFPSPKFPTFLTTKATLVASTVMSSSFSSFFQAGREKFRDQQSTKGIRGEWSRNSVFVLMASQPN